MLVIPTLETERLILREFKEADLDAYAAMLADRQVMRFIGTGQTKSRAETWMDLAMKLGHWQLRGHGLWAIDRREDKAFVGRVGCIRPEGWPGIELGWTLAREHWGHGYATEGAKAARDWAFEQLGLERLISLIARANVASVRVAERVGERQGSVIEVVGVEVDEWVITRERWEELCESGE